MGARYYDATFGRFITRDTDLSQAPYAYCDGDPVNNSDPSGHSVFGIIMTTLVLICIVVAVFAVCPEVGAALLANPIIAVAGTYLVTSLLQEGFDALGDAANAKERQEGQNPPDRPEKAGGGPAAGDQTTTGGEAAGQGRSGNYSSQVPMTTYQDMDGATHQPIGNPYSVPNGQPGHYGYDPAFPH